MSDSARTGSRRRGAFAGWALLLLGSIAAAAMLPQFAIFIPIVAAAWILARLGLLPGFFAHRHPGVRYSPGPDAPLTTCFASIEVESRKGPDEQALLDKLVRRADETAGARVSEVAGDCIAWRPGHARAKDALAGIPLEEWPALDGALSHGAGLVLATRRRDAPGGMRRLDVVLAGDRELLESLALDHADDLRRDGVEVVTTGWLRRAERLRAARRPRS